MSVFDDICFEYSEVSEAIAIADVVDYPQYPRSVRLEVVPYPETLCVSSSVADILRKFLLLRIPAGLSDASEILYGLNDDGLLGEVIRNLEQP